MTRVRIGPEDLVRRDTIVESLLHTLLGGFVNSGETVKASSSTPSATNGISPNTYATSPADKLAEAAAGIFAA